MDTFLGSRGHCADKQDEIEEEESEPELTICRKHRQVWYIYMNMYMQIMYIDMDTNGTDEEAVNLPKKTKTSAGSKPKKVHTV